MAAITFGPLKSKKGRPGGYFSIAKLAGYCGTSESAVVDAARIHGRVRYGQFLCFPKGVDVAFVNEVKLCYRAEKAAAQRRAARAS